MIGNIKARSNEKTKILIGTLLIMPICLFFLTLINLFNLNIGNNDKSLFYLILLYVPIIIGLVLSYTVYGRSIKKSFFISILIFLAISIYSYYNTYVVELPGFDNLGYFIFWIISSIIAKILLCVLYGKIAGWKKIAVFLTIYVLLVLFLLILNIFIK